MNAVEINRLTQLLPENTAYLNHLPRAYTRMNSARAEEIALRAHAQHDPMFGWHFVRAFIADEVDLPAEVLNPWVRRAYQFEQSEEPDEDICITLSLEHPQRRHLKNLVRALLVVQDTSWDQMHELTRLPKPVLQAYDTLFFNVRDRLNDGPYLSGLVYPEGWPVEFQSDYLSREDIGHLMLRAAYNHGLEPLLAVAGLRNAFPPSATPPDEVARQVELMIMRNARMLSQLGQLNSGHSPGIMHAKHLIQAAKAGGQVDTTPLDDITMLSMGRAVIKDVLEINAANTTRRLEAQKHFLGTMEKNRTRKKEKGAA